MTAGMRLYRYVVFTNSTRAVRSDNLTSSLFIDGCLDETKCACRQKTAKRLADECPTSLRPANAVCEYGTLSGWIPTGIYACNASCACRNKPVDPESSQPEQPLPLLTCSNLVLHRGSAIPMEVNKPCESKRNLFVVVFSGQKYPCLLSEDNAKRRLLKSLATPAVCNVGLKGSEPVV